MVNLLGAHDEIQEMKSNVSELEINFVLNNSDANDLNALLKRIEKLNNEDERKEEESEETPYLNISNEARAIVMRSNLKALETIKEMLAKKKEMLLLLGKKPSVEEVNKKIMRVKEEKNFTPYEYAESYIILRTYNEEFPNNNMEKEIKETIEKLLKDQRMLKGRRFQCEHFTPLSLTKYLEAVYQDQKLKEKIAPKK